MGWTTAPSTRASRRRGAGARWRRVLNVSTRCRLTSPASTCSCSPSGSACLWMLLLLVVVVRTGGAAQVGLLEAGARGCVLQEAEAEVSLRLRDCVLLARS